MNSQYTQDSCGNNINLGDKVICYDGYETKGKVVACYGKTLVVLPDYALMALAPYNYVKWIKANTVTKIT